MTNKTGSRKLVLHKVTLCRLDDAELNDVFGGACAIPSAKPPKGGPLGNPPLPSIHPMPIRYSTAV